MYWDDRRLIRLLRAVDVVTASVGAAFGVGVASLVAPGGWVAGVVLAALGVVTGVRTSPAACAWLVNTWGGGNR